MYLLDTSVISALVNEGHPARSRAVDFKNNHVHDETQLFICVASVAEMQFGLSMYESRTPSPSRWDLDVVKRYIQAARKLSQTLDVTNHVAVEQGKLRSKWAWEVAPNKASHAKIKGIPPEQWSDDWPATTLQITENDIWIAATALTHDLTLVTCDKDFSKLAQVDAQLRVVHL